MSSGILKKTLFEKNNEFLWILFEQRNHSRTCPLFDTTIFNNKVVSIIKSKLPIYFYRKSNKLSRNLQSKFGCLANIWHKSVKTPAQKIWHQWAFLQFTSKFTFEIQNLVAWPNYVTQKCEKLKYIHPNTFVYLTQGWSKLKYDLISELKIFTKRSPDTP